MTGESYLNENETPIVADLRLRARHFARALEKLGRTDEVVLLSNVGHGYSVLPGDAESRKLIRRFFAKHLRPGD